MGRTFRLFGYLGLFLGIADLRAVIAAISREGSARRGGQTARRYQRSYHNARDGVA